MSLAWMLLVLSGVYWVGPMRCRSYINDEVGRRWELCRSGWSGHRYQHPRLMTSRWQCTGYSCPRWIFDCGALVMRPPLGSVKSHINLFETVWHLSECPLLIWVTVLMKHWWEEAATRSLLGKKESLVLGEIWLPSCECVLSSSLFPVKLFNIY